MMMMTHLRVWPATEVQLHPPKKPQGNVFLKIIGGPLLATTAHCSRFALTYGLDITKAYVVMEWSSGTVNTCIPKFKQTEPAKKINENTLAAHLFLASVLCRACF